MAMDTDEFATSLYLTFYPSSIADGKRTARLEAAAEGDYAKLDDLEQKKLQTD